MPPADAAAAAARAGRAAPAAGAPPPDPWFVLRGHASSVTTVAFFDPPRHTAGTLLLSGDAVGSVRLWDLRTKRASAVATVGHAHKGVLATLPLDDGTVLVHGREGSASVLAPADGGALVETSVLADRDAKPGGLCYCPAVLVPPAESRLVAIPAEDPSTVAMFDLRSRKRAALLCMPQGESAVGMCMSLCVVPPASGTGEPAAGAAAAAQAPAHTLVAGYEDGSVVGWSLRERAAVWRSKLFAEPVVAVDAVRTSSGGITVVAGGAGNALQVGKAPKSATGGAGKVAAVGKGGGGGSALPGMRDVRSVELKHAGINAVRVRGDGRLFATGGWDHRVRLFSWPRASPLAILEYHRATVNAVAWSDAFYEVPAGGRLLAAASKDTCISLWSVYQPAA